jgi:hypothetical protein
MRGPVGKGPNHSGQFRADFVAILLLRVLYRGNRTDDVCFFKMGREEINKQVETEMMILR